MRIAISGTHSQGKSTFVRDFLNKYPHYIFENEPYRAIMHQHEIFFGDQQKIEHIELQLNHCLSRVKKYKAGDCVIFDRPPSDYIPYSDYSAVNAQSDINKAYIDSLFPRITPILAHLDLIVFVPMCEDYPMCLEDDGHRPIDDFYRIWVDEAFKKLYREDLDRLLPKENAPRVVEITGPRELRVALLKQAIQQAILS
ncbi:AAA family ATPase [Legionella sp. km772]|uniref:AAA family ATPase n=1 Tax=Legionella sp. km772 TaxID=2498111 RepID=UPI0013157BFD|nr:AAA family ATPase [Legionella sp. km772]